MLLIIEEAEIYGLCRSYIAITRQHTASLLVLSYNIRKITYKQVILLNMSAKTHRKRGREKQKFKRKRKKKEKEKENTSDGH